VRTVRRTAESKSPDRLCRRSQQPPQAAISQRSSSTRATEVPIRRRSRTRAQGSSHPPDHAFRSADLLDASLQRAQRFFLRFVFGEFAVVVDASGCVVRDLGDRDEMHRVVEFAVPARVEPVAFAGPAGRLDRRSAVVGLEAFRGREPCRSPTWARINAATIGPTPWSSTSVVVDASMLQGSGFCMSTTLVEIRVSRDERARGSRWP
jgi:hypothetical protein